MKRLIGEQRQRRTALEPNQILHRGPGRHGLLNKFDVPVFGQPFNVAQRLFLCRPRFVGINAQRFPGRDLAKSRQVVPIFGRAGLQFENGICRRFRCLLTHAVRRVKADAEGGDMLVLPKTQAQEIAKSLARPARRAVAQRHVDRAFGRVISGRDLLQVIHASGNVVERELPGIDAPQKILDRVRRLGITEGDRRFAHSHRGCVPEARQHCRNGVQPGAAGNGPSVAQLQVAREEIQLHHPGKTHQKRLKCKRFDRGGRMSEPPTTGRIPHLSSFSVFESGAVAQTEQIVGLHRGAVLHSKTCRRNGSAP